MFYPFYLSSSFSVLLLFCCSLELWLTTPALCCRIALNEWQGEWFIFWVTAQKTNLHQSKSRQESMTPQRDMLGGAYSKRDRWSLIADLHCRSLITEISSKVIDSACSGRQHVTSSNFLSKCEGLNGRDSFTCFLYNCGNGMMGNLEEWNTLSAWTRESLAGWFSSPLRWNKESDFPQSSVFLHKTAYAKMASSYLAGPAFCLLKVDLLIPLLKAIFPPYFLLLLPFVEWLQPRNTEQQAGFYFPSFELHKSNH